MDIRKPISTVVARWSREEEILLTECWIETSENGQIGADRSEDSFWGQIMDDFNTGTTQGGKLADHIEACNDNFCSSTADGEKVSTRALLAYFKRSLQMGRAETS
ncbi:hypothetical protein Tco_0074040 [Tanacetum coccineum]